MQASWKILRKVEFEEETWWTVLRPRNGPLGPRRLNVPVSAIIIKARWVSKISFDSVWTAGFRYTQGTPSFEPANEYARNQLIDTNPKPTLSPFSDSIVHILIVV